MILIIINIIKLIQEDLFMKTNLRRRLTSLAVMLAMILTMVPLAALPDSPLDLSLAVAANTIGGVDVSQAVMNAIESGLIERAQITVNGITATIVDIGPAPGHALTVSVTGTPTYTATGAPQGPNAIGTLAAPTPPPTATGQYIIYARANDGAVIPGPAPAPGANAPEINRNPITTGAKTRIVPLPAITTPGILPNITNQTLLWTNNQGAAANANVLDDWTPGVNPNSGIRIFIGKRSAGFVHRVQDTPPAAWNALQIHGLTIRGESFRNASAGHSLRYNISGIANVGGNYTVWIEQGWSTAAAAAANPGVNIISSFPMPVHTFGIHAGMPGGGSGQIYARGIGTATTGGPQRARIRVEYEPFPPLSVDEVGVHTNVTASGVGSVNAASIPPNYQASVTLTPADAGAALGGNHRLTLVGFGDDILGNRERIIRVAAGQTTTAGDVITLTASTAAQLQAVTPTLRHEFFPDAMFSAGPVNGITASAVASFNADARMVSIDADFEGVVSSVPVDTRRTFNARITGAAAAGLDVRPIVIGAENGYVIDNETRWIITGVDAIDVAALGLGIEITYTDLTVERPQMRDFDTVLVNGVTASGVASGMLSTGIATADIRFTGIPTVPGFFRVTISGATNDVLVRYFPGADITTRNPVFPVEFANLEQFNDDLAIDFAFFPDGVPAIVGPDFGLELMTARDDTFVTGNGDAGLITVSAHIAGTAVTPGGMAGTLYASILGAGLSADEAVRPLGFVNDANDFAVARTVRWVFDADPYDTSGFEIAISFVEAAAEFHIDIGTVYDERGLIARAYTAGTVGDPSATIRLSLTTVGAGVEGIDQSGHFTVGFILPAGLEFVGEGSVTRFYREGVRVRDTDLFTVINAGAGTDAIDTALLNQIELTVAFLPDGGFIYMIDYHAESLLLGGLVGYGSDVQFHIVRDINRLTEARPFQPYRARWSSSLSGIVNLTRSIPRRETITAGIALRYIGSDFNAFASATSLAFGFTPTLGANGWIQNFAFDPNSTLPENVTADTAYAEHYFTGDFILIRPRPDARPHRQLGRTFYNPVHQAFINTTGTVRPATEAEIDERTYDVRTLIDGAIVPAVLTASGTTFEVRFGLDRDRTLDRIRRFGSVFAQELRGQEVIDFGADRIGAGAQGIMRIASGEFGISDVIGGQIVTHDAQTLLANWENSGFASLPLRFRVAAQPRAPRTDRIIVNDTRVHRDIPAFLALQPTMGVVLQRTTEFPVPGNPAISRTQVVWHDGSVDEAPPPAQRFTRNMRVYEFDQLLVSGITTMFTDEQGVVDADAIALYIRGGRINLETVSASRRINGIRVVGAGENRVIEFELRMLPVFNAGNPARSRVMSSAGTLRLNYAAYNAAVADAASPVSTAGFALALAGAGADGNTTVAYNVATVDMTVTVPAELAGRTHAVTVSEGATIAGNTVTLAPATNTTAAAQEFTVTLTISHPDYQNATITRTITRTPAD